MDDIDGLLEGAVEMDVHAAVQMLQFRHYGMFDDFCNKQFKVTLNSMSNTKKIMEFISLSATAIFKKNIINETKLKMLTENNVAYERIMQHMRVWNQK